MSLEQLQCYEDDQYYDQSIKSNQQQSVQSIDSLKSKKSIGSLEKLVSQKKTKDSTLKLELDQFIGLLQKFKLSQLKNDISVVMSTEQEEYYSFQQKQPQDKNQIMLEGYQKCFLEAVRAIDQMVTNPKDHIFICENLDKMKMIYVLLELFRLCIFRVIKECKNLISLLQNQIQQKQMLIQKLQSQLKSLQIDLNQERLNYLDLQQKTNNISIQFWWQINNLKHFKINYYQLRMNQIKQCNTQIKQSVKANTSLRDVINNYEIKSEVKQQSTSPLISNSNPHNQENQSNQSNITTISFNQLRLTSKIQLKKVTLLKRKILSKVKINL
ncbi:unnamed protein product [Paramecium octaurelia]|uniref:Uncharacterized protein n=1 Tax=Paramecium octaurelia TaxID=43137 RepID=A0A8S1TDW4_PAROT|nr:unnamed protein product [Paramecium octaurelia]